MFLHRENIKRGIDHAAVFLKNAVDRVANYASKSRFRFNQKRKQVTQTVAAGMIEKGNRLLTERMWPC